MIHQKSFLSQLSWHIVRHYIYLYFELFGHCILDVVVNLSIPVEELVGVW